MFLNSYLYILLNYTLASQQLYLLRYLYYIFVIQLVNSAQFLYITPLFLSSSRFAASFAPAPVIVIAPLTSM